MFSTKETLAPLSKDIQREILYYLNDNDLYSIECKIVHDEDDYFWKVKMELMQIMLGDKYILHVDMKKSPMREFGDGCAYKRGLMAFYAYYKYEEFVDYDKWDFIEEFKETYDEEIMHWENEEFWKESLIDLIYVKPANLSFKGYYECLKYKKQIILNDWEIGRGILLNWNEHIFIHELLDDKVYLQKYINNTGFDGPNLLSCLCMKKWENVEPVNAAVSKLLKYKDIDLHHSLMYAVDNGYKEIVKMLIDVGADVNKKNTFDNVPLFYSNDVEISEMLLKAGADVNYKHSDVRQFYNKDENICYQFMYSTVLLNVIKDKKLDLIKLYLQYGAIVDDITIMDEQGRTIKEIAHEFNDKEIISLLEQYSHNTVMNTSSKYAFTLKLLSSLET